jgi:hypothetical protein
MRHWVVGEQVRPSDGADLKPCLLAGIVSIDQSLVRRAKRCLSFTKSVGKLRITWCAISFGGGRRLMKFMLFIPPHCSWKS